MDRKYTLIIELENGEEVIHTTTPTSDDIFNYLRIGNTLADKREHEIMVEEYAPCNALYETLEASDGSN